MIDIEMVPANAIVLAPLLWIPLAVALPISRTGVVAVLICPLELGSTMN
jgi:hypothetical protein